MQQLFVELYNYRDEWTELPFEQRRAFVTALPAALASLRERGLEILGFGVNDPATDRRAPYDFFSAYRVPNAELQREFEAAIAASGWYDYFEQVNVSGAALSPVGALLRNAALAPATGQGPPISPVSPYRKHQVTALGRRMAYVDEGRGRPIVLVHGDVMSSFLWRNVIPHLGPHGRAVAVDLIGAGDSDKLPGSGPGTYRFGTHVEYFSAFMDQLDLGDDTVLVGHDWGANVAIEWARRNARRVAGVAFTEALLPPFEWDDWPREMHEQFRFLRGPDAEAAILDDNYFVNASTESMTRMLAAEEWTEIVRPYAEPGEGRRPTYDWPREVPFGDDRTATREALEAQAEWLAAGSVPTLHLAAVPGGIDHIGGRRRDSIARYRNLTRIEINGLHWTPEDDPHGIGKALTTWLPTLP
ncbi:haloalkane dehalogenase [Pseudonocardia spinosispora]|uniref:haloalkane dehalogenase n=1 Tax=Pseudonocardia spinosispora TaxID=103441 RepID=UPI00041E0EE4|nr:haloalkane dehalogenase [Pseudonocardia spinosispora]